VASLGFKRPPVPLIRQAELRAPLALLSAEGAPLAATLAKAHLHERMQRPGSGFLPARQLLSFLAVGARTLDIEDFTFRAVLRAPESQIGSWGKRISHCWRLRDALHAFCIGHVGDAPFLEAGVHHGPDAAWLWRRRHLSPRDALAERQGALYTLAGMVRTVRLAAGPSWHPPAIRIESSDFDWVLRAEGLGGSRVRAECREMAIAIPYDLLDLRLLRGNGDDPLAPRGDVPTAACDFAGSLQQALAPLIGAVHLTHELAAEVAEVSPRTLRRRLREEGTSFRGLLDRIRFQAAEDRLRERTLSLAEIAAELGYANQANFARAFHRWTGESPSAYRRRRRPH
jgi:AraC-like DNA-binding protein